MKLKILFISFLTVLILSSCSNDTLKDITIKEKYKTSNEQIKEEVIPEETIKIDKEENPIPQIKNNQESSKIVNEAKSKVIIEEEKQEDNSVSETSIDYPIHKGRIDCYDESSCTDISLPLQFKYKDNISNTFYLEVISKSDKLLGYFIEYVFKENIYESDEECELIGKEIKDALSDRVTSYECLNANLKIITDY